MFNLVILETRSNLKRLFNIVDVLGRGNEWTILADGACNVPSQVSIA